MKEMLSILPFDEARHASLLSALTNLLHEAYAPLAEQGMHYMASHQSVSKTRERLLEGRSWLFFLGDDLAGTVSLYEGARKKMSADYYRNPGVFLFGQFAVQASLQGQGLGGQVMDFLEAESRRIGARELALDTSEKAVGLIAMYGKRGYRIVAETQWPDVNYRSVILSKDLFP